MNFQFAEASSYINNRKNLTYTITKGNEAIGEIHIIKSTNNDVTEYFFESNARVNLLLFNIKFYDKMSVKFNKNILQEAKLYRTTNNKVEVNNLITWNGRFYSCFDKNGHNGFINNPILLTTACLYFYEPVNVNSIFSEKFQRMIPIKNAGNNRYVMYLPNGNKTTYAYLNGICYSVEAETDWANLKFTYKSNS
ncbi:MAG: hypothetical protein M0D57_05515 [Sphingobacteriales bacterium JAD_PAG50586_3]|nr:MAG: hypothetical protein M0D57_05515 [Sphingobacteriales bacterium JAD_PAG50586_3]